MVVRTFLPYRKVVKKQNRLVPDTLKTLGDHIRKRRVESNQMQRDVAATIGVSEDAVTYWENNRSQPQVQFYPRIISFLGYYPFDHETDTVGGRLQRLRYCNGWSYGMCARAFGVDGTTVQRWERLNALPKKHLWQMEDLEEKLQYRP